MADVLLDSLIDSLRIFAIVFVVFVLFELIMGKFSFSFKNKSKLSPLAGSGFGLIPECGTSVAVSAMYVERKITMGTVVACFIACSDESVFILLSSSRAKYVLPLLIVKFVLGFAVGMLVDLIYAKQTIAVEEKNDIVEKENKGKAETYLWHPLRHALEIFIYAIIINIVIGTIIYLIGEDNVMSFLKSNAILAPILATFVGMIPNCAASIIITNIFVIGGISFGALLAGLCMNAGLGIIYLLKEKQTRKDSFIIIGILFATSLVAGYLFNIFNIGM